MRIVVVVVVVGKKKKKKEKKKRSEMVWVICKTFLGPYLFPYLSL